MAVILKIVSNPRRVDFSVTDADGNTFAYVGYGSITARPSQASTDLTDADASISLVTPNGESAQFKYNEITTFTIDGANQLPSATNLDLVLTALAPFFFSLSAGAEVVATYPIIASTTELDLSTIGAANVVMLTSADGSATISIISNIPANREIKIQPPIGMIVTFQRTQLLAMTQDWQILSSANQACEGSKGEFIRVSRFQGATRLMCKVDYSLTNLL